MNGWIRQKYVYVPTGRSGGVDQLSRPAVGAPTKTSSPESNWIAGAAIGVAMAVQALAGCWRAVMVFQVPLPSGASLLTNLMELPCTTVGIELATVMSPFP